MSMNKFINRLDEKPFHSSGYAKTAHGDKIGSTSAQSFEQRTRLDKNRRTIAKYRDSMIAYGHSSYQADRQRRSTQPQTKPSLRQSRENQVQPPASQHSFREPTSRGHDPYGH